MIAFNKYYNHFNLLSSGLIIVSLLLLIFKGLNLGLDFTGGVSLEIKYDQKADLSKIRSSISKIENANFVVLNFGSDDKVLIKFQSDSELNITADTVKNQLQADNYLGQVVKSETIFPQIGEELRDKGGIAILVAMLVILVYIIFRFQIKFGYGAIAALFHDVFIILGILSIFNLSCLAFSYFIMSFSPLSFEEGFSITYLI